jgi:DNA-binding NtrC family response regulator
MKTEEARPRLLVVDDEQPLREMFQRLFEDQGYEVSLAADGREGWERIRTGPFDLVISDMRMPNMEGLELLGLAKERHPDMEIILMSGCGEQGAAGNSLKQGAYDFIAKPFSAEDVLRLARRAMEKRRLNLVLARKTDAVPAPGNLVPELDPSSLVLAKGILESAQALLDTGPRTPGQEALARTVICHAEKLLAKLKPAPKNRVFL